MISNYANLKKHLYYILNLTKTPREPLKRANNTVKSFTASLRSNIKRLREQEQIINARIAS